MSVYKLLGAAKLIGTDVAYKNVWQLIYIMLNVSDIIPSRFKYLTLIISQETIIATTGVHAHSEKHLQLEFHFKRTGCHWLMSTSI